MRLKLTLRGEDRADTDLLVIADPEATVGQLAHALVDWAAPRLRPPAPRRGRALTLRRIAPGVDGDGRVLPAAAQLGDGVLVSGDAVALAAGPARDPSAVPLARLDMLDASDGVARGWALGPGSWVVGRDPRCDVVLDDPMVSARHARLDVGEVIVLEDLGSANGIRVDGAAVGRVRLRDGEAFVLGSTRLRLRRLGGPPQRARGGRDWFVRAPRVEPRHRGERLAAPTPPDPPEPGRLPWLSALAPVGLGIGLAVLLGRSTALLFALAAPILLLGGFLAQRARRRRRHRSALAAFMTALDELEARLVRLAEAERSARAVESPPPEEILTAAATSGPLLWTRRPEHWNFLTVRLGTASLPSRTVVEVPPSTGADPESRRRLDALRNRTLPELPVVESLADAGSLGVAGAPQQVAAALDAILVHLAGLHSPTDLVLAAAVGSEWASRLSWLAWLPHASPTHLPLGEAPWLATGPEEVLALIEALTRLTQARASGPDTGRSTGPPAALGPIARSASVLDGPAERSRGPTVGALPALVVVLDVEAALPIERCIALSEAGPQVGIYPIWLAGRHDALPAACRTTLEVTGPGVGVARFVRLGEDLAPVRLDRVRPEEVLRFGRRLAPLRDANAPPSARAPLPRSLRLGELLGPELLDDPGAVLARWGETDAASARGDPAARGLPALIGWARDGPMRLDLRAQGPHALVAGTTGSGKSEFLRTWVVGLALAHSPRRVAFLFVDYKGGTAFADCLRLPHCVGLVTDLTPRLARRVLVSLRAELRRREQLFARFAARELTELEARQHAAAPPALVIVVDEFAALAQEVPEFVDGVLDLAQRGRALGMHLILATQRPAGVVKESIRANASLRIALRVADTADSLDVIGVPDAAGPDMSPPGRAMVRAGPASPVAVQAAYTGARSMAGVRAPRLSLEPLGFAPSAGLGQSAPVGRDSARADDGPSDLERLVSTIGAAAARGGLPPPHRPWLDELPAAVGLEELLTGDDAVLALGLSDVPAEQARRLAAFRPDVDGHLAILGPSGAGKSVALRTLAVATAVTPLGGPVEVYGLDFASGALRPAELLPHVGSVVPGDDVERVRRLLRRLGQLIVERTARWAAADAAGLPEFRRRSGRADTPRVVLLIDGFPAFREEWEARPGRAAVYETFRELLAVGRALGMHVALTADRVAALPGGVAAAMRCRAELWEPGMAEDAARIPGRGRVAGLETQLARLGADSDRDPEAGVGIDDPADEAAAIAAYARRHAERMHVAPPVRSLPTRFAPSRLPTQLAGRPVLGLAEETLEPVAFDPHGVLIVAGPAGSGRTNALVWLAQSLRSAAPRSRLLHLAPGDPGAPSHRWASGRSVVGAEPVAAAVRELLVAIDAAEAEDADGPGCRGRPVAVLVESVAGFAGTVAEPLLMELGRRLRGGAGLLVAEADVVGWARVDPLLIELRSARRGLLLQPDPATAEALLRVSAPRLPSTPPGRALFIDHGRHDIVQLPHMVDDA